MGDWINPDGEHEPADFIRGRGLSCDELFIAPNPLRSFTLVFFLSITGRLEIVVPERGDQLQETAQNRDDNFSQKLHELPLPRGADAG